MTVPDLRRLPFMRWDLPFYHDESFHSWFARTVGQNGDETVAEFNMSHDMSPFAFNPEEALVRAKRLPLSEETLARFERATPIWVGQSFQYLGERFRHSDLSFRSPRWCPACLEEQPYRRAWFDILALRRCPYHDEELVSRDSVGNEVPWHATDFSCNSDGTPLGSRRRPPNLKMNSFGHYLLGRLGFEEKLRAPFLDQFELTDVLPACETLGKQGAAVHDAAHSHIELGFSLACGSHVDFAEALRSIARKKDGLHERSPIRECFGRSYQRSLTALSPRMKTAVIRAMEEAITAEAHSKPKITHRDVKSRRITTQEVEDRHGIDAATVAIISRYLGLHRGKKRRPIIEDDVSAILAFADNLVHRKTAADHLNISEHAMQALLDEGYLTRFRRLRRGEIIGARFHIPELDSLLAQLDELPQTGNILLSMTFQSASIIKKGFQHGDLAVKVLRGEVRIAGRKPDVHGFRALIIETGKMTKRPRLTVDPNWLTIAQVQALLNFRKETIWELKSMGVLSSHGEYVCLHAFKRQDVEDVQRTYTRSTDICAGLGITKYKLRDLMAAKGVIPLIRSDSRSFVDTIYKKSDVMKALGLTVDPSVGSDPDLIRFWHQLTTTGKRRFPALLFSQQLTAGGQTIGMTTRTSVLVITYDLIARTVQAVVAPAIRGPSLKFHLGASDWSADLEVLFDRLLEREDEFLKRRSDYNKEKRRKTKEAQSRG